MPISRDRLGLVGDCIGVARVCWGVVFVGGFADGAVEFFWAEVFDQDGGEGGEVCEC